MKLRYSFCVAIFSLVLSGCFTDDDGSYYSNINLSVQDAFTFDNQKNYVVGDTIYFDQKFSRYVKEEGYKSLLDVYETSKNDVFDYSFDLHKYSEFANSYESVSIDSKYILSNGSDDASTYYYNGYAVVSTLNNDRDAYESRVGIVLVEIGSFKLNFDNVDFANGYYYQFDTEGIHLNINHSFSESATLDLEFTVSDD